MLLTDRSRQLHDLMVQPLQNRADSSSALDARPPLILLRPRDVERETLVRVLALDRLRELRDDGVTTDYVGRMYGVSGDYIEEVEAELRRDREHVLPTPDGLFG